MEKNQTCISETGAGSAEVTEAAPERAAGKRGAGARAATKRLARLGMLAAVSVILVAVVHFPIFPAVSFLEYDPADIPILIATFAFGPLYGLLITAVVAVLQGLTVSSASGLYGIIMHFIATGTYVLVAGFIYARRKTRKTAVISLACGIPAMAAIMIPANLIVTPYFMNVPVSLVQQLMVYIILFNLIKAGINAVVTFVVYKAVSPLLHR